MVNIYKILILNELKINEVTRIYSEWGVPAIIHPIMVVSPFAATGAIVQGVSAGLAIRGIKDINVLGGCQKKNHQAL